jgi:hypothetical protein
MEAAKTVQLGAQIYQKNKNAHRRPKNSWDQQRGWPMMIIHCIQKEKPSRGDAMHNRICFLLIVALLPSNNPSKWSDGGRRRKEVYLYLVLFFVTQAHDSVNNRALRWRRIFFTFRDKLPQNIMNFVFPALNAMNAALSASVLVSRGGN